MALPSVTMECKAAADPELRFTSSGMAVAKIRTVSASRHKVTENGAEKWVDKDTCWLDVTCFRRMAENVAESVTKGTLLVVVGKIKTEEWEDKESGAKRSKITCVADYIGPALTFSPAKVIEAQRSSAPASEPTDDPWAGPSNDEPPF